MNSFSTTQTEVLKNHQIEITNLNDEMNKLREELKE